VAQVLYPGLGNDPGHSIAKRQMSGGFGGMLSIRVKGGREAALAGVVNDIRTIGTNLPFSQLRAKSATTDVAIGPQRATM
jgi:cystathionine beta-lyase/cystathionine gamma-synthase